MRGKGSKLHLRGNFHGDHPRLCGEKDTYDDSKSAAAGSPPPMRGKALDKPFLQRRCRITPAYAGKSVRCTVSRKCSGDHPRLCGEKQTAFLKTVYQSGSPPPMRGKVLSASR